MLSCNEAASGHCNSSTQLQGYLQNTLFLLVIFEGHYNYAMWSDCWNKSWINSFPFWWWPICQSIFLPCWKNLWKIFFWHGKNIHWDIFSYSCSCSLVHKITSMVTKYWYYKERGWWFLFESKPWYVLWLWVLGGLSMHHFSSNLHGLPSFFICVNWSHF